MKFWDIPQSIHKINDELGEVCERLATLETDMRWVKWLVRLIAGGVIAILLKLFLG